MRDGPTHENVNLFLGEPLDLSLKTSPLGGWINCNISISRLIISLEMDVFVLVFNVVQYGMENAIKYEKQKNRRIILLPPWTENP